MKYYIIYKTINDVNGMFYYGKHVTENLDDKYLGSGTFLNRAIKKYGKDHFHREIIFLLSSEEEMNNKEREIVTEDLVRNPMCYNVMLGGEGGDTWSGKHHSNETKKKLSEISHKRWLSSEYKTKLSNSLSEAWRIKKELHPDEVEKDLKRRGASISKVMKNKPKKMTDDHRKSISSALKEYHAKMGHNPTKTLRDFHCDKNNVCGKMTYVTNGSIEYRIYIEELQWFLDNGWRRGRSPLNKKPKALTKAAMDSSSGKGKIIVHNKSLGEVKRINPDELDVYLTNGWDRGYLNPRKKK